jgi:DNA-binding NarL/FixJ family response regulator
VKLKPINVVIADSQYLIRFGLRQLFDGHPKINVVDDVSGSEELIESALKHKPDVFILDHNKPSHFNISDIKEVKSISPGSNFLIISADENKASIRQVLQSGGMSFLTKECEEEEIIGAVIATAKGEKFLCHKVIDIILENHLPEEEESCAPMSLTVREIQIMQLTARGLTARKVAEELYLSPHTVYTHRKNIMKKLGVKSASEMIIYAIHNGLN